MVAPNDILGYYRLIERIGAGGMGEVWKAEDTRLGRIVAVKILPPAVASDQEAIGRMRREARTAAQLNHPNIATIHSFEEIGERLFIVMEFVEGEPLTRLIARGPMAEADICRIGRSVAEALAEAHAKGVVHRDIKPDNILVSGHRVKVLDFGIAKQVGVQAGSNDPTAFLTQQGMIVGTVHYMSPEQALGKFLDTRTDIFSLGVVLYQAATGRLPFSGETVTETITRIVRDEPQPPTRINPAVSAGLAGIINRCTRKNRTERYANAGELAAALEMQMGRASTAPMPTVLTGSKLQTVRGAAPTRSRAWIGIATLLIVAAGAAAVVLWPRQEPKPVVHTTTITPPLPAPATSSVNVTASTATVAPPPPAQPEKVIAQPPAAPKPTADQLYERGLRALAETRPQDARQAFMAAVETDPHYAKAHFRLGEMALFVRDGPTARAEFARALEDGDRLDPRERKLVHLGVALANGNHERARKIGRELYVENPNDPDLARFRELTERAERPAGMRRGPLRRRP